MSWRLRGCGGSVTSTVGPVAVYSPTARALVWQGRLPADAAQVIRFQVTPGVTGTGSLSLTLPVVNTAWLSGLDGAWVVSTTVVVNGWHAYLPVVLR